MSLRKVTKRKFVHFKSRVPLLFGCPQKRGECLKVMKLSPKKPNSAKRSIGLFKIMKQRREVFAFIPGIGHNISIYTSTLFRGGKTQDLPRMKYKIIRGALNVLGVLLRRKARSKYGARSF